MREFDRICVDSSPRTSPFKLLIGSHGVRVTSALGVKRAERKSTPLFNTEFFKKIGTKSNRGMGVRRQPHRDVPRLLDYVPDKTTKGDPANPETEAAEFGVSPREPIPRGLAAERRLGSDQAF